MPHPVLEKLLHMLEENPCAATDLETFADSLHVSSIHLQRLFRFAFGMPLARYIRSRRLAGSLAALRGSRLAVLDIAQDCGFSHEQSFIRAFRREFGMTPGAYRRSSAIIPVTPPLQLYAGNLLESGLLFGPEFVMLPRLLLVGKPGLVLHRESGQMAPQAAMAFWDTGRSGIRHVAEPETYYGYTRMQERDPAYSSYMPSVRVSRLSSIPGGCAGVTVEPCMHVRFRYVGAHSCYAINQDTARDMYAALFRFLGNNRSEFAVRSDRYFIERIDTAAGGDMSCMMEWYAPVVRRER